MNSRAIADAIATRFGTLTVNGETTTATALLPNVIGKVALLVYPPDGRFEYAMSRIRDGHFIYPVRLLRDPTDVPARTAQLYAWQDALWDKVEGNLDLGLAYVQQALVVASRTAIDGERYGTGLYDVAEVTVDVHIFEQVPGLAP